MLLEESFGERIKALRIKKNIRQSEPGKFGGFG